jgi:hypothetical protein
MKEFSVPHKTISDEDNHELLKHYPEVSHEKSATHHKYSGVRNIRGFVEDSFPEGLKEHESPGHKMAESKDPYYSDQQKNK